MTEGCLVRRSWVYGGERQVVGVLGKVEGVRVVETTE